MRGKLAGLLILISLISYGQDVDIKGGFIQDSLLIGMDIEYWLSASYPIDHELFLPDSNYNFTPFEFGSRVYFETTTDSSVARDSVVYSLQSFEIDPIQYLNLTAIVVQESDSVLLTSPLDSIYLIELVEVATDTTALIANTDYQEVERQLNSPLILIVVGVLILIGLIVLIVFGGKIRKRFALKRMTRSHDQFLERFAKMISSLKRAGSPEVAEEAVNLWKNYMERLERKPFTKLTSKELVKYPFAEELKNPLLAVDRCVYAKIPSETVYQDFQHLEDFTQNRFDHHYSELKGSKK